MKRPAPGSWQEWAIGLLALSVIAVLSFSAGRFSAPAAVEESHEARHEWSEREKSKSKTSTATQRDTVTLTRSRPAVHPATGAVLFGCDGGVALESETLTASTENTDTLAELAASTKKAGKAEVIDEKKTTLRPDWRVGVLVGAQLGGAKPALEINGPLVIGAQVERRIVGGVSLGVWGTTGGALGGSLSAEF